MIFFKIKQFLKKFRFVRLLIYKYKDRYIYYKKIKNLKISKRDVVLDFGANQGEFLEYIKDKYNSYIYAYEPHPKCYKYLKNKFENNKITVVNKAVSNKEKKVKLFYQHNWSPNSGIEYSEGSSIIGEKINLNINNYNWVQTENIKNIISNFNYIKLIKIDIEGAETEILPHIIKNRNKIGNVLCEFHANKIDSQKIKDREKRIINFCRKNNLLEKWLITWK